MTIFWQRTMRKKIYHGNPALLTKQWNEGGWTVALVKAPTRQKTTSIQVRLEEDVRLNLNKYAQFIDASPSYVVGEALKLLFKRDQEFRRWLGQHTNDDDQEKIEGDVLTKTAHQS